MAEAGPSSPLPPKKSGSKETVQDFDELLKRTVKDKRLSGTNVQKVSDLAIRLLKVNVGSIDAMAGVLTFSRCTFRSTMSG